MRVVPPVLIASCNTVPLSVSVVATPVLMPAVLTDAASGVSAATSVELIQSAVVTPVPKSRTYASIVKSVVK